MRGLPHRAGVGLPSCHPGCASIDDQCSRLTHCSALTDWVLHGRSLFTPPEQMLGGHAEDGHTGCLPHFGLHEMNRRSHETWQRLLSSIISQALQMVRPSTLKQTHTAAYMLLLGYAHDSRHSGSRGLVLLMFLGVFEFWSFRGGVTKS